MGSKNEASEILNPTEALLGRQARFPEGIDCPSLGEIFSELAQLPPSLDISQAESMSLDEQEALFHSIQDALSKAESGGDVGFFEDASNALKTLWGCRSNYLVQATEALANGSRNPLFRSAYGQAGILSFFLQLIASRETTDTGLILHSLRLVGNSCADTDENRAIVVKDNYTFAILRRLLNPGLIQVVIPVIYNLCIDYEPAQSQLAANQIVYILLKLVEDDGFGDNEALLDYVYELIELVGEQEQGIESSPEGTIPLLIAVALNTRSKSTISQFCCLTNCLAAYLEKERFQTICVSKLMVADVLLVLRHSQSLNPEISSTEESQAVTQSRLKINQALSEVSASPLFAERYPLDSPLAEMLKSWLATTKDQLQICACIMLGNLARSDAVCEAMVRDLKIHEELIGILNSNARGAVLHSALGFLKNLAIASDNRLYLGRAGIVPAISHLWGYETVPQVQLAATSIARQLIISSVENISRLLDQPPSASSSGNITPDADTDKNPAECSPTYLSLLLALFEKTDSTPIKTEIGRIVASICRTLVRESREQSAQATSLLGSLFSKHEGVALPVGAMVTQTQWPVVRSEAWFALALMASSKPGASAVVYCLQKIDGFVLIKQILSAEGPGSDAEIDKVQWAKDRDNMIILVQELLRNDPDTLPDSWKTTIQELMRSHVSKYLKQGE
ncbi:hypothetical protein P175DRAFT_0439815 [Aspergillus ochraceoroseus IBT 24754]|uniref:Uncharacterized protein n=1 Tax=Aspergillus ochraceoroseus IBT 24754 TaxID=1392256 RepID=A0A2T5LV93_9EURO|nr:uncharacterized protein P175DRAFT_0439815 [Aspergillus ochraceoroseus IBT 24754]PTU20209.1 hypothetical protein P175DRAFT_0439815 [Aspergillus ochraceoroseus IBT 24754]